MNFRNTFSLVAGFILLAVVLGCGTVDAVKKATPAAEKFHEQFNAGEFEAIYENTDQGFKDATSKEELIELLTAVQKKLGTIKNAKQGGWNVSANEAGTLVTAKFDLEFADAEAKETLVFRANGDDVKLFNFNINSPALVTK